MSVYREKKDAASKQSRKSCARQPPIDLISHCPIPRGSSFPPLSLKITLKIQATEEIENPLTKTTASYHIASRFGVPDLHARSAPKVCSFLASDRKRSGVRT